MPSSRPLLSPSVVSFLSRTTHIRPAHHRSKDATVLIQQVTAAFPSHLAHYFLGNRPLVLYLAPPLAWILARKPASTINMAARQPLYPSQIKDLSTDEHRYLVDTPYVWNDFLIDASKLANIHLDTLSPRCLSWHAKTSLGQFDNLSTEIICSILDNVDLCSLMRLRATNSRLRCIIDDWEPFRETLIGSPDVLRALLATKASVMSTVPQISRAIFTTRCDFCGECGNFIQLLKLARCCFRCLANDRRLLSVPFSFAQNKMGLNPKLLPEIPHLTTIQRAKFWGIHEYKPSHCAVDYTTALRLTRLYSAHKVGNELEAYVSELPAIIRRRHQKARGVKHRRSGVVKRCGPKAADRLLSSYPVTTAQSLHAELDINPPENDNFRFLSAMHAPGRSKITTFDPHTETHIVLQNVEYHGYCSGCRFYWNLISPRHPMEHTIYTEPELDAHLQNCFYARLRWNQLYPAGYPVDELRTVQILKQRPPPLMLRHATPGLFEKTPPGALYLYAKSNLDDKRYGDLLLGSSDATSQASWATSSASAANSLWRYIHPMIERKGRKRGDVRSWQQAVTLQLRKPRLAGQRVQCQNGLPTSSSLHPDHTEIFHYNGEDVNLWFETDATAYPQPWFLENLSQ